MSRADNDRVIFHSVNDMSNGYYLKKCESLLNQKINYDTGDINDILELHNVKLYFDNGIHLTCWSKSDISRFETLTNQFARIIGKFVSSIDDSNFLIHHSKLSHRYVDSFWTLINNYQQFNKVSSDKVAEVLLKNPHQVRTLLKRKKLVNNYKVVLSDFLKTYEDSAEIILSIYELENMFSSDKSYLPDCLTIVDKENIISKYIKSDNCNPNYLPIIQNLKKHNDFYIADKVRLEAKRRHRLESNRLFENNSGNSIEFGVSISYPNDPEYVKNVWIKEAIVHYEYSLNYIEENNQSYLLLQNFKTLFEYLDEQNRITLTSKVCQLSVMERVMIVRSKSDYVFGIVFTQSEMTSHAQIYTYNNILTTLGHSLENILQDVFCKILNEQYVFVDNATFTVPSATSSAFEKVRVIAPEFESILKQFKLFVENDYLDFELLQMSSGPTSIKDVPSLNPKKYIYANNDNQGVKNSMYLLFSDQAHLTYVEPFKDKQYRHFVDLLTKENEIYLNNYEAHQKKDLSYLIENCYVFVDDNNQIKVTNWNRILVLKDIFENEVASYHRYPKDAQEEVIKMVNEKLLYFDSSLFSKPEQNYFNYFLNKSEFKNGLDLRNSYLHGTQANPNETKIHQNSYFTYLKLITLVILKIEDDLSIYSKLSQEYQN